jgi:Amt family ammonium transporter
MLEAGLVQTKNVVAILTINIMIYVVASLVFFVVGYNIMFGHELFFLNHVQDDGLSKYALFLFQMAFVGKTVNIMSGGVSERTRIFPLLIFTVIMAGAIYPTVGSWIWGGGFLGDLHDLAGSTVIHSVGGWALLAGILIIGSRKNRYKDNKVKIFPASNIPLVTLGVFLLWIGWFGFNGGSVLKITSIDDINLIAKVIINTNTAGLAGALSACIFIYLKYKTYDITMILNGALGGLVAITAGADVLGTIEPIFIGAIGGILVVISVLTIDKLHLDDPVGALSVHLVNGIWGTLAVSLFNNEFSFLTQLKSVVIVGLFVFTSSFIVIYLINKIIPFRVDEEGEYDGLDYTECKLEAYPDFTIQTK